MQSCGMNLKTWFIGCMVQFTLKKHPYKWSHVSPVVQLASKLAQIKVIDIIVVYTFCCYTSSHQ
jgi:hypothetical protein